MKTGLLNVTSDIDTPLITRAAGHVSDAASLSPVTGHQLFTLAPLYWGARVEHDLIEAWAQGNDEGLITIRYTQKVINTPQWEFMLQALTTDRYALFAKWLEQCRFTRPGEMFAPFRKLINVKNSDGAEIPIDVWCITGYPFSVFASLSESKRFIEAYVDKESNVLRNQETQFHRCIS